MDGNYNLRIYLKNLDIIFIHVGKLHAYYVKHNLDNLDKPESSTRIVSTGPLSRETVIKELDTIYKYLKSGRKADINIGFSLLSLFFKVPDNFNELIDIEKY